MHGTGDKCRHNMIPKPERKKLFGRNKHTGRIIQGDLLAAVPWHSFSATREHCVIASNPSLSVMEE
jgi:hypothetical protein